MARRIYLSTVAMLALAVIYQALTIGYGTAAEIIYQSRQSSLATALPADQHLTVIYEREMGDASDLLHLKIDTTYHAIGKGAYHHEFICRNQYSLRAFDGKYHSMDDVVAACFVADDRDWQMLDKQKLSIVGYECLGATTSIDGTTYHVWYTEALPYLHAGARTTDGYQKLILEAGDKAGGYRLRAKYIEQQIG